MGNKKPKIPEKTPAETALEQSVDEMMDVEADRSSKANPVVADGATTAPVLPQEMQSEIAEEHKVEVKVKPSAKPVVVAPLAIEQLDDISAEVEGNPEEENEPEPEADPDIDAVGGSTNLDDASIDEAVDDIAANESDTVLAVADAKTAKKARSSAPKQSGSWKHKLKSILKNKWTWIITAIVLVVLFALPITRYTVLGLFIKKSVTVQVLDSKTATPVSNASVKLGGASSKTDGNGKAAIKAGLGQSTLDVAKQYYQTSSTKYFVGFKSSSASVKLVATGRLVPIKVTNKVTGSPLPGAHITVLGTTAITDKNGQAVVAMPAQSNTQAVKLSATGYNLADVTVLVTDKTVVQNSFALTPAGQIYFLSNLSGKLDVVKANLDGTGRKVVYPGTGHEDKNSTSLLASRDWKFLVLKARREGNLPALYLIDTSNDKVTQFDNSDSNSTLVGWYGHNFIYDLTKNNQTFWQAGRQTLKSYDADHAQLNQLDQNQAEGDANSYSYQTLNNYYIVNGAVAYDVQWSTGSTDGKTVDLSGKNDTIRSVQPNGNSKKDYQSFPSGTIGFMQAALADPSTVYFAVPNKNYTSTNFYAYQNQNVKPETDLDQNTFNQGYPTYLLSPTGSQTFWTDLRDGKNTLFIGDANAKNGKQIATLSEYSPYGWFTDSYTLVSKKSSELYIMPAGGLKAGQQPLKITDYYKPAQTFNGYGYGYGGL